MPVMDSLWAATVIKPQPSKAWRKMGYCCRHKKSHQATRQDRQHRDIHRKHPPTAGKKRIMNSLVAFKCAQGSHSNPHVSNAGRAAKVGKINKKTASHNIGVESL